VESCSRVSAAEYASENALSGCFEHARQAELADDVVLVRRVLTHIVGGNREVEPFRKLDDVNLVAAADDRLRVVVTTSPPRAPGLANRWCGG